MSRLPYSPNKLSPWPKVLFRDETVDADSFGGGEAEPKSNAGFDRSGRCATLVLQPKMKSLSRAGTANNRSIQGRRSSFGSTQLQMTVAGISFVKPLDREKSGQDVQRLLKLRMQRLQESKDNGDETEVYRLKHLNLFDDIEKPTTEDDKCENDILEGSPKEPDVVYEIASPITAPNVEFLVPSPPFTHGHTSELCEHMKLQQACGASIPEEFSSCIVHPEPGLPTTASAGSSTALAHSTSHKSFKSSTEGSSSNEPFRASLAEKGSSPRSEAVIEEDSFLYIANYMRHRSGDVNQHKKRKCQSSGVARAKTGKTARPRCTCSGHQCRTYLSSTSSQHCSNCKLPEPQPEIQAAMKRINDVGLLMRENGLDVGLAHDEDLRQDVELVELYNAEMEKRCSKGVWWEGWLVVEDLKRQGFVGS